MSGAMYAAASLYNDPRYFSKSEIRIRNNKLRRQRIFKRQVSMLIVVITIILFMIFFNRFSVMTGAQSDTYTPEFKYFTTVTVHTGDTLWNIAKEHYSEVHYHSFNEYLNEIYNLNHLAQNDKINAGECIIIPYYSTEFK